MTFDESDLERQQRQVEILRKRLDDMNATLESLQRQASETEGAFEDVPDEDPRLLAMIKQARDEGGRPAHPDQGTSTSRMPGLRRRGAIRM